MGSSSHFPAEDKLYEKFDYHGWKKSLDLTLEEHEVLDYVKEKIPDPPSNALAATKSEYNKAEVKAKKIIKDSIDKRLVSYISDLNTSKEIYDRLVSMFKVSDANQILFLKVEGYYVNFRYILCLEQFISIFTVSSISFPD